MLKKYYLGGFFWVLILHKRYQNMSGFTDGVGEMKSLDRRTRKMLKLHCAFLKKDDVDKDTVINSTPIADIFS